MAYPSTTVTTWQRRQYARNTARRAAGRRAGIITIGAVVVLLGAALAVVGAVYPGAIVAVIGALIVTGALIS
jgi:hypothetical protein